MEEVEKKKYKNLFEDLLYIIEKSLQIVGLSDVYRRHSERSRLFMISQRLLYAIGTFQMPFLMIGEVILINNIVSAGKITHENFLKIAEVTPCLVICSFSLMKSSRLLIQKQNIVKLLEEYKEMWPGYRPMDEETKVIVDRYMMTTKRISILYSMVTHVLSCVYNLFPVGVMIYNVALKGHTDYILPYLVWYPYDNSKNFLLWTSSYISHFYAGIYVTGSIASCDCMFGLMTSHLSMHLELLGKQLQKIPLDDDKISPRKKLDMAIHQHNKLVKLCGLVEKVFSPVMLFNLVASSIMLCVLLFSITIAPPGLIAKYSVFIGSSLAQILIMSWYGSKVMSASNKLSFAAYSCPWTDLTGPDSLAIKKSLMLLMVRAKKPLCITAYGFTHISMKTFSTILKASWSYFTLLRAVYVKRNTF